MAPPPIQSLGVLCGEIIDQPERRMRELSDMEKKRKDRMQVPKPAYAKANVTNPFAPTGIEQVAGVARRKHRRLSVRDMARAVMKEAVRHR